MQAFLEQGMVSDASVDVSEFSMAGRSQGCPVGRLPAARARPDMSITLDILGGCAGLSGAARSMDATS